MHVQVGTNTKLFSGCVAVSPLEPPPPPGANAPARARGRGAAVGTRDPASPPRSHPAEIPAADRPRPSLPHHITPPRIFHARSAPRGVSNERSERSERSGERSGERSDERSDERADRFANARVAAFDAAFPGALPALNAGAVALAARLGVALGGDVQLVSSFDRKHYHYPDLPHGYQITQQRAPIVVGGRIEFFHPDAASRSRAAAGEGDEGNDPVGVRRLGVERIQLEMDTGKSSSSSLSRDATTLLDLNRAGAALVEIVTAPDLRSGEEAAAAVASLRETLRFLGVSDANMEDGSLRCDVNVSVRRRGEAALGERCEVKNLNSLRAIRDAVRHEASRQATAIIARGEPGVRRETRAFDPRSGRTTLLRAKENLLDYRFAPEPDVPPVVLTREYVRAIEASVPELPSAARARLADPEGPHALLPRLAEAVVAHPATLAYYERALEAARRGSFEEGAEEEEGGLERPLEDVVARGRVGRVSASDVANFVANDLPGAARRARLAGLRKSESVAEHLPPSASPERVGALLGAVARGRLTLRMARDVVARFVRGDERDAAAVVRELFPPGKGKTSSSPGGGEEADAAAGVVVDADDVKGLCAAILEEMPAQAEAFRAGKTRLMGLFVGAAMRRSGARADPRAVAATFEEMLGRR